MGKEKHFAILLELNFGKDYLGLFVFHEIKNQKTVIHH
jgi:hypothetical protein